MTERNLSEQAFDRYCSDPVVQQAIRMTNGTLSTNLLQDCFMAGAGYAIERCKREHHQPATTHSHGETG